jgi:hypothetical protein
MLPDAKPGRAGTGEGTRQDRRAGNVSAIPVQPSLTWMPPVPGASWGLPALHATVAEASILDGPWGGEVVVVVQGVQGGTEWATVVSLLESGDWTPGRPYAVSDAAVRDGMGALSSLDERFHRQLATAIVASTATHSTPQRPHRPCIGYLCRQAPKNSAFPAWDRLLGTYGNEWLG